MTETNLLPCPFCGGDVKLHEFTIPYHYWDVRCDGQCFDYFSRDNPTREAVIEAWNTRAERTCRNVNDVMKTGEIQFVCSECGGTDDWARPNYCPHCGARVVSNE